MSIIGDILDTVKEVKDGEISNNFDSMVDFNKFKKKSLSRLAKDSILQFPVLCSNGIDLNELTMVNKALERQFAAFLILSSANDDIIEYGKGRNDFIKRFHSNVSTGSDTLGNIAKVDKLLSDNTDLVLDSNKALLKPYLEDLNMKSLNSMLKSEDTPSIEVRYDGNFDMANITTKTNPIDTLAKLRDLDVKKSNEMLPTIVEIPVTMISSTGPQFVPVQVALKAINHLIPSEEMTYNIVKGVQDKRALFRFLKFTTGEISFFKDYILNVDRMRQNAINSNSGSKWWKVLYDKSRIAKMKRFTLSKGQLLPNASIVISMEEVDYIRSNYNIDLLSDMKAVKNVMETYFLISFIVVDSAAEVTYFYFDGEDGYETYTFRSLERAGSSDNTMRDIGNIMKGLR